MPITATIQIGNSDDKLTQLDWATFCQNVLFDAEAVGKVHFNGGPPVNVGWQNYCVVVEVNDISEVGYLKRRLRALREIYRQDSIALTIGETEFVS